MAKSFIDVVQDSPSAGLGIPDKTKKPPLSNQYTTSGTAFRLYTSRVVGSLKVAYDSSVIRSLGTSIRGRTPTWQPTSRATQGRNKQILPPNDADSQVYPRRGTAGAGPDAIPTGSPRCSSPDAHRAPSSSSQV